MISRWSYPADLLLLQGILRKTGATSASTSQYTGAIENGGYGSYQQQQLQNDHELQLAPEPGYYDKEVEEKQPFLNYNNNAVNEYQNGTYVTTSDFQQQQQPPQQQQQQQLGNFGQQQPLLHSSWEDISRNANNALANQLNFQTLSVSMDRLDLEMNPPNDRYYSRQ